VHDKQTEINLGGRACGELSPALEAPEPDSARLLLFLNGAGNALSVPATKLTELHYRTAKRQMVTGGFLQFKLKAAGHHRGRAAGCQIGLLTTVLPLLPVPDDI
jgi:hypothetical protein